MIRIYYYSDNFLLSCFHGDRVVGWYNAGYKIVHILIGLAGYYGSVFLPTVSNQSIVSAENTRNLVQHSFRLLLVFSLPMLVYGVGFAHEIITTIFGVEYINGVPPFQILLVAMVIVFAGVVFTNSLIAFDGQKTLLILVSIAAALSVGLNLLLIPQIGMTGAALTTTLAEFIVLGGGVYTLRSRINLEIILRTSLKVILAATIMALTLWSLRSINVFLAMMSSALMYIISLLVLGVLHRRDWTQLVNLIKFQLSSNAITER
jgi:O-antigen/teichoic acid export membrane protein